MKHILMGLFLLLTTLQAIADCQTAYINAAFKRQRRNNRIMYGAVIVSPLIAPVAVTGGLLVGAIVYDKKFDSTVVNTFGKVRRALAGETTITLKRVSRHLKKQGIIVDENDPTFVNAISEIIADLNTTNKFCPSLGYDEDYNDKYQLLNFSKFTKLVAEEYLVRSLL